MAKMLFPFKVDFQTMTLDQAAAVCWEYCQNDDEDKTVCVHNGCPVLMLELERRKAICCNQLRIAGVIAACT